MKDERDRRTTPPKAMDDLRRRAQARMVPPEGDKQGIADGAGEADLSPEEVREALHELATHQIELEMQNEELRRAQIEVEEARDRYTDLYDFAPVGYVTLSTKGLVAEANLTFAEMLGVERGKLIRKPLSAFVDPADQDVLYRQLRDLAEGERQVRELRMRRRDGASFWAEIESVPVSGGEAGNLEVRCAVSDVTERRELEARVRQAQTLESLGVLAGGVAHDFNNLLQAVLGLTELTLLDLPADSPVRGYVEAIGEASERAAQLSSQMLAYAGEGKLFVEPLDLSAAVGETVRLLESSVGEKVELSWEPVPALPAVMADATQIRQVIMNLVLNASEAIGAERGTIRVRVGARDLDRDSLRKCADLSDLPPGRYVCLEVADTGCGMDESTRAKVFEPFFTTKFTGRGLGLAALQGIVRGHGGAVRLDSEPGRGTTFQVFFPAGQEPLPAAAGAEPASSSAPGTGTVLVIDDEAVARMAIEEAIRELGFEVLTASDGWEGLEVLRRHAEKIRLVLLDVKMPHMGAEETLPEIRRVKKDARIVIVTGYSEKETLERFAGEGLAGFLFKPFRLEELSKKIREALGG